MSGEKLIGNQQVIENKNRRILTPNTIPGDKDDVFTLFRAIIEANKKGITFSRLGEIVKQETKALPGKGDIYTHQSRSTEKPQPPDLSKIPLWKGRKIDGMPLDFIRNHYGQYLSAFGAENDSVFQDQIRARDARLIKGLHNQFREEGKKRKLHDFVRTRSARVDRELENVTIEDMRRNARLASNLYNRAKRQQNRAQTTTNPSKS